MQHLYWRQIIACCIILSISLNGFGQKGGINQPDHDDEKFWAGAYVGFISSNFQYTRGNAFLPGNIGPNSTKYIISNPVPSINFGIPITNRIYKNLLFRYGIGIILDNNINNNYKTPTDSIYYRLTTIVSQIPVALKYESDRYDFLNYTDAMRHYIFAGATLNYNFSNGLVRLFKPLTNSTSDVLPILKSTNLTYDLGFGLTFIVNDYIRISPEIKFSYGINNLIKPAVTNSPLLNLDKLTGNYVSFSLHIEN
ncbi:MAG: hypothetical protein RLZZ196_2964 [Bacteroidota bacterium]|jgi:hypothetical protein